MINIKKVIFENNATTNHKCLHNRLNNEKDCEIIDLCFLKSKRLAQKMIVADLRKI